MSEFANLPPRADLLPDNVQVTQYNADNGAIREVLLDGHYAIHGYDPALQEPDVQKRYQHISQLSMSALVLRAAGLELQDALDVLDAGNEYPEADKRVGPTFLAVHALNQAARVGLVHIEVVDVPGPEIEVRPTPQEITALNLLANAAIMIQDKTSWRVLADLRNRYSDESNLLAIYTKALAIEPRLQSLPRDSGIQHISARNKLDDARDEEAAQYKTFVEDYVSIENMKLQSQADPQLLAERKDFIESLAGGGIDLRLERIPRTVRFKGVRYTFEFPGLEPSQAVCFTLRLLGLDYPEIADLLPNLRNHKSLANRGATKAGVPVGVEPILWCMHKKQVRCASFTRDPRRSNINLPDEQLDMFQHHVQDGLELRSTGTEAGNWRKALRYAYRAFGGTNRREAALVAAGLNYIKLRPEDELKTRLVKRGDTIYTHGGPNQKPVEKAVERLSEQEFEENLIKDLKVPENETTCTVNWRGLQADFDFNGEVSGDAAAIAAASIFGPSPEQLRQMLPKGISQKRFVEHSNGKVGFSQKTLSRRMIDIFLNGNVSINIREFVAPAVRLTALEQKVVPHLGVAHPTEIQKHLGISRDSYYKVLDRLYTKYDVPDYPRLVWSAIASGHVPALAHLLTKKRANIVEHPSNKSDHLLRGSDDRNQL